MNFSIDGLRILDIDFEHRPLNWAGADFTWGEITGIGWKLDDYPAEVRLLGFRCQHPFDVHHDGTVDLCGDYHYGTSPESMLSDFLEVYNAADLVTGHYIRAHDLRSMNGMLLEHGLPPLPPKLTSDTKLDLGKRKNLAASQANLAEVLGVPATKVGMSQARWRSANRLSPEGMEATHRRVLGDVLQHVALREKLLELGWLMPPKVWRPLSRSPL